MNLSGSRIRAARELQNPHMSQEKLAAKLQLRGIPMSQAVLSKIELGTRYITDIELYEIARILDVGILWLMDKTDKEEK